MVRKWSCRQPFCKAGDESSSRKLMADSLKIRVLVRPKAGILDPQGEAVRSALPALGFGGVKSVHVGRLIEMELESADEVDAMCRRLLANPTIEEYEWEVVH